MSSTSSVRATCGAISADRSRRQPQEERADTFRECRRRARVPACSDSAFRVVDEQLCILSAVLACDTAAFESEFIRPHGAIQHVGAGTLPSRPGLPPYPVLC